MSHKTTLLDLIVPSSGGTAAQANALLDAASPAMLFGRRGAQCSGLNWFYYGGVLLVDGVPTLIPDNSAALALTANATNYIEATRAGVVSKNTTGFTGGSIPLYSVVCGSTTATDWTDYRAWVQPPFVGSVGSIAVTGADVDLTVSANSDKSRCEYLTTTGVLTGNRNVIVPNYWRGIVFNNNSGPYTTTFKTASGTGITVAQGKRAILLADGTNVVRITPET